MSSTYEERSHDDDCSELAPRSSIRSNIVMLPFCVLNGKRRGYCLLWLGILFLQVPYWSDCVTRLFAFDAILR